MTRDPSPPDPTSVPIVPPSSPRYTVGSVIGAAALFLFACVPYRSMMKQISYMTCCDPDGGLSQYLYRIDFLLGFEAPAFYFSVILLWILLGFLLIPAVLRRHRTRVAARKDETWWELLGAPILFPLSLVSTIFAINIYERYHGWAVAVPILIPPLIGLYGIWARFPHARHRADIISAVVGGALLVLTIAPVPLIFLDALTYANREPDRTAEFRRLTPDSTLRDYLDFRPYERRRKDWFDAVRRVKSRQTDAVTLLKEGRLKNVEASQTKETNEKPRIDEHKDRELASELWRFGLEATPSLCEAFHERLREVTAKIDPVSLSGGGGSGGGNLSVYGALEDVWIQLRTITWLVSAHCDLNDTLTDIETKLRTVPLRPPVSYEITAILNTLATLPRTH